MSFNFYLNFSLLVTNLSTANKFRKQFEPRPQGYKTFSMLNSAEHKIILLINVKLLTIVGILTFISMMNTKSERLKARNFVMCWYSSFYEQ